MADIERTETHVYNHDGDSDRDESGVAAILRAFIKNPGGALQIVCFVGGLYGVYYAIEGEIRDVRAAQVENSLKFSNKLDIVVAQTSELGTKVEALYGRSDTRYAGIIGKLSAHDVDIAEIKTGVNFIVSQYNNKHAESTIPSLPQSGR